MGNVRFPQYNAKKQAEERGLMFGFKIGVWTTAALFRDRYEVDDEAVEMLMAESIGMAKAFGDGEYDPKYMFRDLEKRTGIKFHDIVEDK